MNIPLWAVCEPQAILVKVLSGEKPDQALITQTLDALGCLNKDGTLDTDKADREIARFHKETKNQFKD